MTTEPVTLKFDWASPPLNLNQRKHWAERAEITATIRRAGYFAAVNKLRGLGHVTAQLVWWVNTRTRRDTDNLAPTLKALCDGLVDAGVVSDDAPAYMTKPEPIIRYRHKTEGMACIELVLTPGLPREAKLAQQVLMGAPYRSSKDGVYWARSRTSDTIAAAIC